MLELKHLGAGANQEQSNKEGCIANLLQEQEWQRRLEALFQMATSSQASQGSQADGAVARGIATAVSE